MIKFIRAIVLLTPLFFLGFTPQDNSVDAENYYNFQNLKISQEPREMKIVRMENIAERKPVLEDGVLITYKNRYAADVKISGDFSNWKPVNMSRNRYGVWYYFLNNSEREREVRYKFLVDGVWMFDPMNNEKKDDNAGSYVSLIPGSSAVENHLLTYRFIEPGIVEFRLHKPGAKIISLVGDFNNWNPENDLMEKKDDGVWMLRKRLSPGIYRYKFIIDGNHSADLYNENTASDDTGEICSLIRIK